MIIKYRKGVQRTHLVKTVNITIKKYSLCLQAKYSTVSSQGMCLLYDTLLFTVADTHPISL